MSSIKKKTSILTDEATSATVGAVETSVVEQVTEATPEEVAAVQKPRRLDDEQVVRRPQKPKMYIEGVGRRKSAIARVRLWTSGTGTITVRHAIRKEFEDYRKRFADATLQAIITSPLKAVGQMDRLDFTVHVVGGGTIGQAESIRHGISRALIQLNPVFRQALKKKGYLTRDPRIKERKKPGLQRARRAPQWTKR